MDQFFALLEDNIDSRDAKRQRLALSEVIVYGFTFKHLSITHCDPETSNASDQSSPSNFHRT